MSKIYILLSKHKGVIISWIVVLIIGGYLQKGCSDNKYLREENAAHRASIKQLRVEKQALFDLQQKEIDYRKLVQDSLSNLEKQGKVLKERWKDLNEQNGRYKKFLGSIDTDDERDSLLSAWYPFRGQRGIHSQLEN